VRFSTDSDGIKPLLVLDKGYRPFAARTTRQTDMAIVSIARRWPLVGSQAVRLIVTISRHLLCREDIEKMQG
jgi:hypothetical protein